MNCIRYYFVLILKRVSLTLSSLETAIWSLTSTSTRFWHKLLPSPCSCFVVVVLLVIKVGHWDQWEGGMRLKSRQRRMGEILEKMMMLLFLFSDIWRRKCWSSVWVCSVRLCIRFRFFLLCSWSFETCQVILPRLFFESMNNRRLFNKLTDKKARRATWGMSCWLCVVSVSEWNEVTFREVRIEKKQSIDISLEGDKTGRFVVYPQRGQPRHKNRYNNICLVDANQTESDSGTLSLAYRQATCMQSHYIKSHAESVSDKWCNGRITFACHLVFTISQFDMQSLMHTR